MSKPQGVRMIVGSVNLQEELRQEMRQKIKLDSIPSLQEHIVSACAEAAQSVFYRYIPERPDTKVKCPYCHYLKVPKAANYCPACGSKLY